MKISTLLLLLLATGCTSGEKNAAIEWKETDADLEGLVLQNEGRNIFILFGSDLNEVSIENKRILEHMYRRSNPPTNLVFYYGDASSPDSIASQILKKQGLEVPANLFYLSGVSGIHESWTVMDEVLDKGTYKTLFVWSAR